MISVRINVNRDPQTSMECNNKFIQIARFDMKHITFIQILKPTSNAVGKMQMGEGELEGSWIPEATTLNIAKGVQTIRTYETM